MVHLLKRIYHYILEKIKDNRGSPLTEEAMLIGLSIVMLTILTTMVLDVLGWSTNMLTELFNNLDQLEKELLDLFN
ncbi:MAG: hypothetical protein ACP6IU_07640 [Candidatus Asgardarchaeia archaeon]